MGRDFIIPLNELAEGRTEFRWKAGTEFFERFANPDILDAEVDVHIAIEKSGSYIGVDGAVEGTVTVPCDRCLEDLALEVRAYPRLSVKFGTHAETADEGAREIVQVPEEDSEWDMSQIVYDYACLSLPMQKVHEAGGCNPETVRYLKTGEEEGTVSPFAGLRSLLQEAADLRKE